MVNNFVKHHGVYFYQRDMESMSHYPPQYGIAANASKPLLDYD
jgi:hypothetical protein